MSNEARLEVPYTFGNENSLAFRLYSDNRPNNLEIAPLQKGLILLFNDIELVEEGAGFGVPIVKCTDSTYFSSTAELYLVQKTGNSTIIKKIFNIDTVSKKQIQGFYVNEKFYSAIHRIFEVLYLNRQMMRPVFDWIMRLRKALGVHTNFTKTSSKGRVAVTYSCSPNFVKVDVDLTHLDKSRCDEILLLNEQGATNFRKYMDSSGKRLFDREVGAWTEVKASDAYFIDVKNNVSFKLANVGNAHLFRGREQVKDRFSWAGLAYSLNPKQSSFSYTIKVETF